MSKGSQRNIALVGYGTRGDIQPFVSLAAGLASHGHEVSLLVPRNGAPMARASGLNTIELPFDIQQMFDSPAAQQMLAAGRINKFFKWLHEEESSFLDPLRAALLEGTREADTIVSHGLMEDRCAAIAEARGARMISVHFAPSMPSRDFPSPFVARRNLGPLNRTTHRLMLEMLWRLSRDDVATLRGELGIPPARSSHSQALARGEGELLLAYSPAVAATPADWPTGARSVGALTMSPKLRESVGESGLSNDLEAWLDAGPPPVFLGFGSMPVLDVKGLVRTIRGSLEAVGVRGVIGAGWSELEEIRDETIFSVEGVDHQSLLPRCLAAVHHGGSGTVHASLAAGVPTLVCSVFADQPYWGCRCRVLGVGDTFPFKRLDQRRLTAGLEKMMSERVRTNAADLARRIAVDEPLPRAIAAIEGGSPEASIGEQAVPKPAAPICDARVI
ncbi:MAG TPA: glycosyltransferase [Solirubrobacterales bacterium]